MPGAPRELFQRPPDPFCAPFLNSAGFVWSHQRARERDETLPGGMHLQDVADHQGAAGVPCRVDQANGRAGGVGRGFFEEDVRARFEGGNGVRGVCLGVGADADGVGTRGLQRVEIVGEFRKSAAERGVEAPARFRRARDQAGDREVRHPVVRARVRRAHVAAAGDEHAKGRAGHTRPKPARYVRVSRSLAGG